MLSPSVSSVFFVRSFFISLSHSYFTAWGIYWYIFMFCQIPSDKTGDYVCLIIRSESVICVVSSRLIEVDKCFFGIQIGYSIILGSSKTKKKPWNFRLFRYSTASPHNVYVKPRYPTLSTHSTCTWYAYSTTQKVCTSSSVCFSVFYIYIFT